MNYSNNHSFIDLEKYAFMSLHDLYTAALNFTTSSKQLLSSSAPSLAFAASASSSTPDPSNASSTAPAPDPDPPLKVLMGFTTLKCWLSQISVFATGLVTLMSSSTTKLQLLQLSINIGVPLLLPLLLYLLLLLSVPPITYLLLMFLCLSINMLQWRATVMMTFRIWVYPRNFALFLFQPCWDGGCWSVRPPVPASKGLAGFFFHPAQHPALS